MKKLIEIISLSPNFDILTQTTKPWLLLKYKDHWSATPMQLDLMISQKEALNMFGIDDFSFAAWKMAEIDIDQQKDWKTVIKSFKFFDNRPITMESIELVNKSLAYIIGKIDWFDKILWWNQNNNQQKSNNQTNNQTA